MLAAASSEARELAFSTDARIGWDNNIFRSSIQKVDDGFVEFSPEIAIRQRNSKLDYDINYRPTYQSFFDASNVDGFDHRASLRLFWRPTSIDTFGASSDYLSVRRLSIRSEATPIDPTPILEATDRIRIKRATARFFYDRQLTPKLSLRTIISFDDLDYNRGASIDSRAITGRVSSKYAISSRTSIGLAGSARRRDGLGRENLNQFSTETDIWDVSASIDHVLSPTVTLSAQAGPSFIRSRQDPPRAASGVPSSKRSTTSYFAAIRAEKRWKRSNLAVSYTRSETAGGGQTASSIVDVVSLRGEHQFDRKWGVRSSASWNRREEISSVPGLGRAEFTQYSLHATIYYSVDSHLTVLADYSFFFQDQNSGVRLESIGDVHTVFLSLRYTFDPVIF